MIGRVPLIESQNSAQMSSDSLQTDSSQSSTDSEESAQELEVDTGELEPYQDEPLASDGERDVGEDEEADIDGLTPAVLEARLERRVAVHEWLVCCLHLRVNYL